jgi:hypothetical protein
MWRRELRRNLLSRGQVRRCRHRRWFPAVTEMWLNHVIERCCVLKVIMVISLLLDYLGHKTKLLNYYELKG